MYQLNGTTLTVPFLRKSHQYSIAPNLLPRDMTSPLLASLFAATPVPMTVAHPVLMAPMASVAATTYSMRFQMLLNALLERFPADLGLVQVGPSPPNRVSAPSERSVGGMACGASHAPT